MSAEWGIFIVLCFIGAFQIIKIDRLDKICGKLGIKLD